MAAGIMLSVPVCVWLPHARKAGQRHGQQAHNKHLKKKKIVFFFFSREAEKGWTVIFFGRAIVSGGMCCIRRTYSTNVRALDVCGRRVLTQGYAHPCRRR